MAIVDADYSEAIEAMRGHIANGTQMSGAQMVKTIAVIKDAIARMDVSTEVSAVVDEYATQKALLSAFTSMDAAADIVAGIATATAALDPLVAALDGVDPGTAPTYVTSPVADG